MSTFRRNAIIAGYINSYCLVCECFFETEEQTFNHTKNEEHESRLLAYPFLEKYGNNGIRKVKAGYFCGYCSILMATAAKVNLHIAEKMHYYNKGDTLLKQCGRHLTAFDDVLISEAAWHCIADDACAMCNAEFDDGDEHKTERAHLIKLMQNRVEFGSNNNLYRRIDKNYFQCLTCNNVLTLNNLDEHFNEETHIQKYIQCQEEKKKYDLANPKVTVTPNKETKNFETENNGDVKNDILIYEENTVAVTVNNEISSAKDEKDNVFTVTALDTKNNETNTVTGNINTTEDVKVNGAIETKTKDNKVKGQENPETKTMQPPKESDNKPQKKKDETKDKETNKMGIAKPKVDSTEPVTYAEDNKLIYNLRKPNAICKTCLKSFPSNFRALKEHVNGRHHINKCKLKPKPSLKKDKLTRRETEHFVNVTTWKDEFIREIRPGIFHCGSCNLVLPAGAESLTRHHQSSEHSASLAASKRRLQWMPFTCQSITRPDIVKQAFFEMVVNHIGV